MADDDLEAGRHLQAMHDDAHDRSEHVGASYVILAHGLGRYLRELLDAGFTRDEAFAMVRDKNRAFWGRVVVDAEPNPAPEQHPWDLTPEEQSSESSIGSVSDFSSWRRERQPE
jgi:hypothetical protein